MRVGDVPTFELSMAYMAQASKVFEDAADGEQLRGGGGGVSESDVSRRVRELMHVFDKGER